MIEIEVAVQQQSHDVTLTAVFLAAFLFSAVQLLAKLEGKGKGAAMAPSQSSAVNDSGNGNSNGDGSLSALDATANDTADSRRLRQAQLQGTCAKLILACVRHRYTRACKP